MRLPIFAAMTDESLACAPDPDRALLRVTGPDRLKFLQGLVTNDMGRLARDGILYAALLTPQGKYLTDFFLVTEPESVLIDAPAAAVDDLLRRLGLYRLRSQVEIAPAEVPVTRGTGPAPKGALSDPRHPGMGWRLYGQARAEGPPPDWDALRVAHLVPEHGRELIPGESYILELGFPRLNGVDFRKGCYVGQEVTARMHHKTELRKGLAAVSLSGSAEPGTTLMTEDGREAGTLGTVAGDRGLAWLRFDRAGGRLRAGAVEVRALLPQA